MLNSRLAVGERRPRNRRAENNLKMLAAALHHLTGEQNHLNVELQPEPLAPLGEAL